MARFPSAFKLLVYAAPRPEQQKVRNMTDDFNTPEQLVDATGRFIDAHNLIPPGGRVVVGVSGGCDSVAALAVLRELAGRDGREYQLSVAHLDHALRDNSADDAEFVSDLAERWGLTCIAERLDVAALADEWSLGIETAARRARYAFLGRAAAQAGADRVALGHHADDNAETIVQRIFRGSHLRGAGGMRPSRPLENSSATVVRPLLESRRADIEAFCRARNLAWRTDPTNAQTQFTRNFIRHELLPLIRERINPKADLALLRLGRAVALAEDILAARGRQAATECITASPPGQLTADVRALGEINAELIGWVFRDALEKLPIGSSKITSETLDELSALVAGDVATVNLPDDYVARRREDQIVIAPAGRSDAPDQAAVDLAVPGTTDLPSGMKIVCTHVDFDSDLFRAHCAARPEGVEFLDADRVFGQLTCRTRSPGDRFTPLGAPGSRTVGDFLTNAKLDRTARLSVRCVCDDRGIVYLAPLRIDQRVKITPATSRMIRIEFLCAAAGEAT